MGRLDYSSLSFELTGTRSDVTLEVTTLSYARGQSALKVYGTAFDAVTSSFGHDDPALLEPSIHSNFTIVDDFSKYSAGTETLAGGGWDNRSTVLNATFGKVFPTTMNFSEYDSVSLWAKSEYAVCLYVMLEDSRGNTSNPIKFGFLSPRWKRMDGRITWPRLTPAQISRGEHEFELSLVTKLLFIVDSEPNAEYYIDEIILFGCDESNINKKWTKLLITAADVKQEGRTSVSEIAGGYGDVIHQDRAFALRGDITFKTGFREMDDDIRFIDGARRHQTKLFLRVGGEGWPVYVSDYKQRPEENVYGIRNELNLEFIEAE